MSGLIIALSASIGTVIVALVAWFAGRRLQSATAEKTTGEGWDLLTKGLATRLTALETENQTLRTRVSHTEKDLEAAKGDIRVLKRTLLENDLAIPTALLTRGGGDGT